MVLQDSPQSLLPSLLNLNYISDHLMDNPYPQLTMSETHLSTFSSLRQDRLRPLFHAPPHPDQQSRLRFKDLPFILSYRRSSLLQSENSKILFYKRLSNHSKEHAQRPPSLTYSNLEERIFYLRPQTYYCHIMCLKVITRMSFWHMHNRHHRQGTGICHSPFL